MELAATRGSLVRCDNFDKQYFSRNEYTERLLVIIATSTVVTADSAWITEPAERVQVEPSLNSVNDYFVLPLNYNLKSTLKSLSITLQKIPNQL